MRRWLAGSTALVGVMLTIPGCGGGDDTSDELVRIHARETLDLRMDESDGAEHVFHLDGTWVVTRDGTATETVNQPAPGRSRTIKLSSDEFGRIKAALSDLDLPALQDRFPTDKEGDGTTVVTYGGSTVTLDSRVMGLASVKKAPGVVRPFSRLVSSLATLEGPHRLPFEPSPSAHQVLQGVKQQMERAMRRRTCEETKKLVARNPGLSAPQKRKLYSQVRDQPCP